MPNRRQFLSAGSAVVAAAAFPNALFAERIGGETVTNASVGAYTQGWMTQERLTKLVGSRFTVFLDNNAVSYVVLDSVEGVEKPTMDSIKSGSRAVRAAMVRSSAAVTTFYAHFSVQGKAVPEGTYLLDHGTLGRVAIFLVPSGSQKVTATFSYLGDSRNWQLVHGPGDNQ